MEKLNLDLLDLILTGNFCNLDFGTSKAELISIGLIPNDWRNGETFETSMFWKFGNFELYFDEENKLSSIWNDNVEHKLFGGDKIEITNYWILTRRKITLQKTIKELLKLKLDFSKELVNPGYIELKINNGVYFLFDFPNDESDNHNIWTMTAIGKKIFT